MNENRINELIAKALTGEIDSEEDKIFQRWLNEDPENKSTYQIIKNEWYTSKQFKIVNSEEIKEKIWQQRDRSNGNVKAIPKISYDYVLKIAASILIFLTTTWFVMDSIDLTETSEEEISISTIHKFTLPGQKSKIFLPDGSEVWLNAGSKVSYQENFNDSVRVIHLEGEAFFDVVKDPIRPFMVYSGKVSTTALGTSFNISAYSDEVSVSLITGKVLVEKIDSQNSKEDKYLQPGESAVFQSGLNQFKVNQFDPLVIQWKDGILSFKDATFNEVISRLERWYGVETQILGDRTIIKHFTGKFDNESLENVMENVSFALKFDYELKNKNLKIRINDE